jgi:hypothetical protein
MVSALKKELNMSNEYTWPLKAEKKALAFREELEYWYTVVHSCERWEVNLTASMYSNPHHSL